MVEENAAVQQTIKQASSRAEYGRAAEHKASSSRAECGRA